MNQTGSGMYHPIVKEQAPLSRRKAYRQSEIIERTAAAVNHFRSASRPAIRNIHRHFHRLFHRRAHVAAGLGPRHDLSRGWYRQTVPYVAAGEGPRHL